MDGWKNVYWIRMDKGYIKDILVSWWGPVGKTVRENFAHNWPHVWPQTADAIFCPFHRHR